MLLSVVVVVVVVVDAIVCDAGFSACYLQNPFLIN